MGCCGCDNRTSTVTAAVFSIVQCIVGIILATENLTIFYGECRANLTDDDYLCYVLQDQITFVRVLLILVLFMYFVWGSSSVLLLIGNKNHTLGYIQQWTIISSIVITMDIVLPSIFSVMTYNYILFPRDMRDVPDNFTSKVHLSTSYRNLMINYWELIVTFTRGGLITICCDIALTVYVGRRANEIQDLLPPPYVSPQTVPVGCCITIPTDQSQDVLQGVEPQTGPQHYQDVFGPHYEPGNIPQGFEPPPPKYESVIGH